MINEVFELNPIVDDPRYEGFALISKPSTIGRDSLDDDLTPGFGDAEMNPNWRQPMLAKNWKPPKVIGRVSEFNDYPCVDFTMPAFSSRAVEALRQMLVANGELLELISDTETRYFLYNILTISDALDRSESICDFWCDPPTTATEIDFFAFDSRKIAALSIFRIRELPMSVFVTSAFAEKVDFFGLNGFAFRKVWPLPKGTNWRTRKNEASITRNALRQETLVVVLPFDNTVNLTSQINHFEASVDKHLQVKSPSDRYFGSYEGHDIINDTYRMFFSAPSANALLERIQGLVETYEWFKPVVVHLRRGRLYDTNVKEESIVI
jgi:hypothetical protein